MPRDLRHRKTFLNVNNLPLWQVKGESFGQNPVEFEPAFSLLPVGHHFQEKNVVFRLHFRLLEGHPRKPGHRTLSSLGHGLVSLLHRS